MIQTLTSRYGNWVSPSSREPVESMINRLCAVVEDYPRPGITFRDLTPVFADGKALHAMVDSLIEPFAGGFDAVAGIEARGFLLAAAAAYAADVGVVTVRKPNKLPRRVYTEHYELEYGSSSLQLHMDDLAPGTRVLVLDDVLATGGTLAATTRLFASAGARVAGVGVVLELNGLRGRSALAGHRVRSLARV